MSTETFVLDYILGNGFGLLTKPKSPEIVIEVAYVPQLVIAELAGHDIAVALDNAHQIRGIARDLILVLPQHFKLDSPPNQLAGSDEITHGVDCLTIVVSPVDSTLKLRGEVFDCGEPDILLDRISRLSAHDAD